MNSERTLAQEALAQLERAVVELLRRTPTGLTNAEIARELGIETGEPGEHRNMLTWSIVGRLQRAARIERVQDGRRRLVRLRDD